MFYVVPHHSPAGSRTQITPPMVLDLIVEFVQRTQNCRQIWLRKSAQTLRTEISHGVQTVGEG